MDRWAMRAIKLHSHEAMRRELSGATLSDVISAATAPGLRLQLDSGDSLLFTPILLVAISERWRCSADPYGRPLLAFLAYRSSFTSSAAAGSPGPEWRLLASTRAAVG